MRTQCLEVEMSVDLSYTVGKSAFGVTLVAADAAGVVAVLLGDHPDPLRRDLGRRFPDGIVRHDEALGAVCAAVTRAIDRPGDPCSVSLAPRGTAFQYRVWAALREIPPGKTLTYAELAGLVGAPSGARAVAGACAANPIAILIPCHRVIRSDGSLGGYRWGLERKRLLLAREEDVRRTAPPQPSAQGRMRALRTAVVPRASAADPR